MHYSNRPIRETAYFEAYAHYYHVEEATGLADLLEASNIPYLLEKTSQLLDATIVGEGNYPPYVLKVPFDQFLTVDRLLQSEVREQIAQEGVPSDYYLREFSNEDLLAILKEPDDWSVQDIVIARFLLTERGEEVSESSFRSMRSQRLEQIKRAEQSAPMLLPVGYVVGIVGSFFFPLLAVVVGMGIGWSLYAFRDTAPDGQRYYRYAPGVRRQGLWIIGLSILSCLIGIWYWGELLIVDFVSFT